MWAGQVRQVCCDALETPQQATGPGLMPSWSLPHDVPLTNRIRQGDTITSEVTSQEPGNAHPGHL